MAYDSSGLRRITSGIINMHVLYTTDAVLTATGADYISDAGPTDVLPGKGLAVGDPVLIIVVGAIPASGEAVATCTDQAWAYVSAINSTTGAGTLTAH